MNNLQSQTVFKNLVVLNWNANGLTDKKHLFTDFLVRHKVDVACITETHFLPVMKFKICGYSVYRQDRVAPHASGGVAIVIKKNIKHHELLVPRLQNLEAVSVKIFMQNGFSFSLVSGYLPPNKRFVDEDFNTIFYDNNPTILMGDFNSKHTDWGCRTTNPKGNQLNNYITQTTVNLSAPEEPTFHPWQRNQQPDILDIVLFNNFNEPIIQETLCELTSDHLPVIVSFTIPACPAKSPEKLINGKVNWIIFHNEIDSNIVLPNLLQTPDEIENCVRHFTESIKKSIKKATARRSTPTPASYIRPPMRILDLIKEKHILRRRWQRYRDPEDRLRLNRLIRKVKTELDLFKIKSYQQYLSNIRPEDGSMWQATKRILRSPSIIPPLQLGQEIYQSDAEKCEVFADFFENAFSPNPTDNFQIEQEVSNLLESTVSSAELPIPYISLSEIRNVLNSLPLKKAPGHDLVTNLILKNLTPKAHHLLKTIFNACLHIGYFPVVWKHAEVIVIHKPNKPVKSPSSYRPISLLPTLSKVFEKLIQKRLNRFIEEAHIIPPHQFGFRHKHSTTQQLARLSQTIVQGFEDKKHSAALFLDVAQAFDKVWHKGLLYKLFSIGLPNYLRSIISSFLENRTFSVKINCTRSSARRIRAGVPQGSILGPILFNIYMCDLPIPLRSTLALFADDTALISQDRNINSAIDVLQTETNLLLNWFSDWKIALNPQKCEAKIFSLRKFHVEENIQIHNNAIPWNDNARTVKYLGVLLDTKLTYKHHINSKLNQANSRLAQMYPVINKNSSIKTKCALLIYKGIFRPLLTYACPVWGPCLPRSKLNQIQVFQNKFLRIATNSPWYIRNRQIHEELDIPTVSAFISKLSLNFLENLHVSSGAVHFSVGRRTLNRRLRARLPQDIL
jgi:exonuclease III